MIFTTIGLAKQGLEAQTMTNRNRKNTTSNKTASASEIKKKTADTNKNNNKEKVSAARTDKVGGGLYACPRSPVSIQKKKSSEDDVKKKKLLVFPYSLASESIPGKNVSKDAGLANIIKGVSFKEYGTTSLLSSHGYRFSQSMCLINNLIKSIIVPSTNLPEMILIWLQFILVGLFGIILIISWLFSTLTCGITWACGMKNNAATEPSDPNFWVLQWNLLWAGFYVFSNMIFHSFATIEVAWKLYFKKIFSGDFEEIKRVLSCNLEFISLLYPFIIWSQLTQDQIDNIFGEITYLTMGICWVLFAVKAIYNHFTYS